MNIPGFTAERSLFNSGVRYQATTGASFYGGAVQPAQSDVFHPDHPVFCLKTRFIIGPNGVIRRIREIGFWNPVTRRCV